MRILKICIILMLPVYIACGNGGPLTPTDTFFLIRYGVEKHDTGMITQHLSSRSLEKFDRFREMLKKLGNRQITILADKFGCSADKLKNFKDTDCVSLYFFSDTAGIGLNRFFLESILSINIDGSKASIKTESGVELDFLREGPYWKFDMSNL